jgi:dienelactone hydrolase
MISFMNSARGIVEHEGSATNIFSTTYASSASPIKRSQGGAMRALIFAFVLAAPFAAEAGEAVTYIVDGETFEGYRALAPGDSKGLVLIIHDWDGLTEYEMKRADMLANNGYDAFAVDLFGKGNRPTDTAAKKKETSKLYQDRDRMRSLIVGGLQQARKSSDEKAVVMGYCFGGAATLELARSGQQEGIVGYASFHGGLATPEGQTYPSSTPPILIAHGGGDTSVTMDDVAALAGELESAGVPYEIQVYSGAPHGFTVFGSDRYQKRADEQSWNAFSDFIATNLLD